MNIKSMKLVLAASAVAALVACGGTDPVTVATSNVTASVSASTVTAISGKSYSFPSGVSELRTTGATAVTINQPTTGAATFAVTSPSGSYSGVTSFGSCVFTVTVSTLATVPVGTVLTVNPCNVTVQTAGTQVGNINVNSSFVLGATTSSATPIPVTVSATGVVTVNGTAIATVTTGLSG